MPRMDETLTAATNIPLSSSRLYRVAHRLTSIEPWRLPIEERTRMGAQDGLNVELYTGPLFLGCLFSYFLSGCAFIQAVYFFQTTRVSKRHTYVITLVSVISLVELASTVVLTLGGYYILCVAIPRGDLSFQTPPAALSIVVLNCFITVCVQGHFALRIRLFSQGSLVGKFIVLLIAGLALAEMGSSIGLTYFANSSNRELARFTHDVHHQRVLPIWFVSTTLADVVITLTLVSIYLQFRKNTERSQSKGWLNTLILHTVENGAVTSVGAMLHFVFYIVMPNSLIHTGLAYVNCRLYANVLFAAINANRRFQREVLNQSDTSITFSNISEPSTGEGESGVVTAPNRVATSVRRHSLSGPLRRSALIGTRTEGFVFTEIESSTMSGSRSKPSEGNHPST